MLAHWVTGDWTVTFSTVALYGCGIKARDGGASVMLKNGVLKLSSNISI